MASRGRKAQSEAKGNGQDDAEFVLHRVQVLESENEQLTGKIGPLEAKLRRFKVECDTLRHALVTRERELEAAREEVESTEKTAAATLEGLRGRIDKVRLLETGLMELYLELLERPSAAAGVKINREVERENLVRRCGGDALVILDQVRTHMRLQLGFKDDYEQEKRGAATIAESKHEAEVKNLQGEIHRQRRNVKLSDGAKTVAMRRLDEAERAKDLVVAESRKIVEDVKAAHRAQQTQLHKYKTAATELRREVKDLKRASDAKEMKLMKVLELEEALKSAEHHERVHISKIEEANAAAMARVEEKMERLQRQVDRKDALAAELKRTKQELLSFKRNMRFANFEEASAKAKRAVAEVEALKTELERTKGLLRRARVACGDKDTRIAKMKVEYRELFKAVQEAQREKEDDTDPSLLAAENPHYAEYFRDKLKKKNTEFNEMKARLRRMMSAEIHLKGQIRGFEAQRARQEAEMAKVRGMLQEYSARLDRTDAEKRKLATRIEEIIEVLPPPLQAVAQSVAQSGATVRPPASGARTTGERGTTRSGDEDDEYVYEDDNSSVGVREGETDDKYASVDGAGSPEERAVTMRRHMLSTQALTNANAAAQAGSVVRRMERKKRIEEERAARASASKPTVPLHHENFGTKSKPTAVRRGGPSSVEALGSPDRRQSRSRREPRYGSVTQVAKDADEATRFSRGGASAAVARRQRPASATMSRSGSRSFVSAHNTAERAMASATQLADMLDATEQRRTITAADRKGSGARPESAKPLSRGRLGGSASAAVVRGPGIRPSSARYARTPRTERKSGRVPPAGSTRSSLRVGSLLRPVQPSDLKTR